MTIGCLMGWGFLFLFFFVLIFVVVVVVVFSGVFFLGGGVCQLNLWNTVLHSENQIVQFNYFKPHGRDISCHTYVDIEDVSVTYHTIIFLQSIAIQCT